MKLALICSFEVASAAALGIYIKYVARVFLKVKLKIPKTVLLLHLQFKSMMTLDD